MHTLLSCIDCVRKQFTVRSCIACQAQVQQYSAKSQTGCSLCHQLWHYLCCRICARMCGAGLLHALPLWLCCAVLSSAVLRCPVQHPAASKLVPLGGCCIEHQQNVMCGATLCCMMLKSGMLCCAVPRCDILGNTVPCCVTLGNAVPC